MPTYGFSCTDCGPFDVRCAMAESDDPRRCPRCSGPARREFGAPGLRTLAPGLRRALDAQERTADRPDVVTSIPQKTSKTRITRDPRHLRLPRP